MRIIFLAVLFFINFKIQASHLLGGEITWECLRSGSNTGKYIFTMKIYRDCNGISLGGNEIIEFFNGATTTSLNAIYISNTDISPKCYSTALQVTCANTNGSPAAVEE